MKRSRSVKLVLLGSAAMALSACGEDPDALFRDTAQCTRVFDAASCRTAEQQALAEHVRTAPRFATREACEAEMGAGNCGPAPAAAPPVAGQTPTAPTTPGQQTTQPQSGGGSFFLPLMMGYMMGRSGGLGGQPQATPIYRDRAGAAYAGRTPVGSVDAAGGFRPTARGGFGGTGNTRNVSS